DGLSGATVVEMQGGGETQVAVAFADVQLLEGGGRHPVGHAQALGTVLADQGGHAPGALRRAAMVVRALPETACPAADAGRSALGVGKTGLVDQRAVAEQPYAGVATEVLAGAIDFRGVKGHGDDGPVVDIIILATPAPAA